MFSDTNRGGINVAKTANHIKISDNEMTRVGEGVDVLGSFVTITHNSIHDLTMVKNTPTNTTSAATIAATDNDDYGANGVVVSASNVEIAFNHIVNAKAPSYDYGTDGGAVELFTGGAMVNVSIHDNITQGCQGFMESGGTSGASISNVSVYKNLSIDNGNFLDIHNGGGSFAVKFAGFHAFNNTVYDTNNKPKEMGNVFLDSSNAAGIEFDHNIIWLNDGDSVFKQTTPGYHHDNLFYLAVKDTHLFNNWTMVLGPGESFGMPLFTNAPAYDLSLIAASPGQGMGGGVMFAWLFKSKPPASTGSSPMSFAALLKDMETDIASFGTLANDTAAKIKAGLTELKAVRASIDAEVDAVLGSAKASLTALKTAAATTATPVPTLPEPTTITVSVPNPAPPVPITPGVVYPTVTQ